MKKKVDINVTGIHIRGGNEEERIDTSSRGIYDALTDGSVRIEYEEVQDMGGQRIKVANKVTVPADLKSIEVMRTGAMNSKMVFGSEEYVMDYKTPYGAMQMEVITKSLDFKNEENGVIGEIYAEYMIKAGDEILSDSKMIIEIKER
ncbi:MAG: DUF1934 domain-containing protein [Butyrivibrio sp.]|nr:DUF1934 domain-containing protein [Butyrivibrio sp.]